MARSNFTVAKWQKAFGCRNIYEICWCDKCALIEKRMEAGIAEAKETLQKHIADKENSPEKDAMLAVLKRIEPLTTADLFKSY